MQEELGAPLAKVAAGEPYSPLELAKRVDRLIYRYTGCEDLICDTPETKKQKILAVEDMIEFFFKSEEEIRETTNAMSEAMGVDADDLPGHEILLGVFGSKIFSTVLKKGCLVPDPPEELEP